MGLRHCENRLEALLGLPRGETIQFPLALNQSMFPRERQSVLFVCRSFDAGLAETSVERADMFTAWIDIQGGGIK